MATAKQPEKPPAAQQSERVMQLIREATALQVEMLGAAARVWSEMVEHVANYNRELTNELMRFSSGDTDASAAVDKLVDTGRESVEKLMDIPAEIAEGFKKRVRKRAGRPIE